MNKTKGLTDEQLAKLWGPEQAADYRHAMRLVADYLAEIGKRGGKAKSAKKAESSARNLEKARAKRVRTITGDELLKQPPGTGRRMTIVVYDDPPKAARKPKTEER